MKYIVIIAVAVGFLVACTLAATAEVSAASVKKSLAVVSAAELPAQAAALIKAQTAKDRPTATVQVVKTCVVMRPASAQTLVAAIAKAVPEMAAIAVQTAAREQPKAAAEIAKAAARVAPQMTGSIVTEVCRAVPADYRKIAVSVAQVAPNAGREILVAVAAALPELKPKIEAALAGYTKGGPSVAAVLDSSALLPGGTISSMLIPPLGGGPTVAPPYKPPTGVQGNISPADTTPVPPGGRNYAQP